MSLAGEGWSSPAIGEAPQGYKEMMDRLDVVCGQLSEVKEALVDTSMRGHLLNVDILTLISPEALEIIENGIAACKKCEMQIEAVLADSKFSSGESEDAAAAEKEAHHIEEEDAT